MKKAAISSIIAIILGYLGTVFGAEIMNWPQLGHNSFNCCNGGCNHYLFGK